MAKYKNPDTNVPLITSNIAPFSQQIPLNNPSLVKYGSKNISFANSPQQSNLDFINKSTLNNPDLKHSSVNHQQV
jgi:hypothetical protein